MEARADEEQVEAEAEVERRGGEDEDEGGGHCAGRKLTSSSAAASVGSQGTRLICNSWPRIPLDAN